MTAGSIAFEAYRKAVQGVAYDGTPIPRWHELKRPIQLAWEAAAHAVRTRDMAVRERTEIEERLAGLVRFLAHADKSQDSTARAHARALDLVWVLYPALSLQEHIDYLAGLILAQENPDASQEQTEGHP